MDARLRDLTQLARGVTKGADSLNYGGGTCEVGGEREKRAIFGEERSRGGERRGGEAASETPEKPEEFGPTNLAGGSGPTKVTGGSGSIRFSGVSDAGADDRVPAKRTIGAKGDRRMEAQNSAEIERGRIERKGGESNSEDDRSDEEEDEALFNKVSIVGVAGTPVLVRPEGDRGTRKGSPADRPEPRAEHQRGKGLWSGDADDGRELEEALQVLDEIHRCTGVIPRRDTDTQTESTDVNPVPCDDTHGPRRDDRLGRIEHMVEELRQVQFQEASRRKRAQKARKHREKRRRKGVVLTEGEQSNGPIGPVDASAAPEAGESQPPIDVWEPPTSDDRTEGGGSDRTAGNRTDGNPVEVGAQRPRESPLVLSELVNTDIGVSGADLKLHGNSEVDHRERDVRRMLRAVKKIEYDRLRRLRAEQRQEVAPAKRIRVYVTLADQVGLKHLEHRVGRREIYDLDDGAWHKFRKKLMQKFRLKGLRWNLWEQSGGAWACLPKVPVVMDQDELRLEVWGKKARTPNRPGTSKRKHFERPNQKRSRKSFTWTPRDPVYRDVATTGKLNEPGRIGYRELDDVGPEQETRRREENRERALNALQARKDELTQELGERGRVQGVTSPDPESVQLKREVEELERLRAAKQRCDDRDDWRREKDEKFRTAHANPPEEKFVPEAVRDRKVEAKEKKSAAQAEFLAKLQAQREEKAKRQAEKEAEGRARQSKAEARTRKKGSRGGN
jgi:hypothetical protein